LIFGPINKGMSTITLPRRFYDQIEFFEEKYVKVPTPPHDTQNSFYCRINAPDIYRLSEFTDSIDIEFQPCLGFLWIKIITPHFSVHCLESFTAVGFPTKWIPHLIDFRVTVKKTHLVFDFNGRTLKNDILPVEPYLFSPPLDYHQLPSLSFLKLITNDPLVVCDTNGLFSCTGDCIAGLSTSEQKFNESYYCRKFISGNALMDALSIADFSDYRITLEGLVLKHNNFYVSIPWDQRAEGSDPSPLIKLTEDYSTAVHIDSDYDFSNLPAPTSDNQRATITAHENSIKIYAISEHSQISSSIPLRSPIQRMVACSLNYNIFINAVNNIRPDTIFFPPNHLNPIGVKNDSQWLWIMPVKH